MAGNGMDDRRVRKTKKALRESLARLMMEKSIRDISVRELTELADLNRATFYLHYRDVHDLQQRMEAEAIAEIDALLLRAPAAGEGRSFPALATVLAYIADNADLCRAFFGANSGRSFLDKLCTLVGHRCLRDLVPQPENSEKFGYFSSYAVYGCVGAIARWVESGMQLPPGQMAELLGGMVLRGVGCFQTGEEGEQR